jgi:predicted lipase
MNSVIFDSTLIEKCADISNRTYTNDIPNSTFIEDKVTDCQTFVIFDGKNIIITGSGSQSIKDWWFDFQISKTKVPYLRNTFVHTGFLKQYNSVRDRIHTKVLELIKEHKVQNIICTGHSLFGAISTIIALDCCLLYKDFNVSCVTFGSPRVGGKYFTKLFNKEVTTSFRCVRFKDPISFTPLPIRFRHVNGGIHFGKTISFKVPKYNFVGCRVSDHNMMEYWDYIKLYNCKKKELFQTENMIL